MNNSIGVAAQSRQEERRKLKEMAKQDDLFDYWVRLVLKRAPAIYVFVNITMLIWIAQSIFNSDLSSAPKSIYLIAPLLTTGPINSITPIGAGQECPDDTEMLILKTSPGILQPSIPHQMLTTWGETGVQFCVERLELEQRLTSKTCPNQTIGCSGYCVEQRSQCPITGVTSIPQGGIPKPGWQKFLTIDSKDYYYTRRQNPPIVYLMAAFSKKCANDEHYNEVFNKQSDYWASVTNCGSEGTISSFYSKVDEMDTNTFFANNKVHMTVNSRQLSTLSLGTVQEFQLSQSANQGCQNAKSRSHKIQPFLRRGTVGPQFTQSLLIIAFILLVAEICWLIAYFCFDGFIKEKHLLVLLISIIELVIISFIYNENKDLFYIQELSNTLAKCLKQSLPAMNQWHFGIESPQVFKAVIFLNVVFLALFISMYIVDRYVFTELRRRPFAGYHEQ